MRIRLLLLSLMLPIGALADTVHLRNATFDPGVASPVVAQRLKSPPTGSTAYYIVQFNGKMSPANRQAIESATGAQIVAYVPENAFVVRADGSELDRLHRHRLVTWVGRFEPAFKLSADVGKRTLFSNSRWMERSLGLVRTTVTLFDGQDVDEAIRLVTEAGFDLLAAGLVGPRWIIEMRGPLHSVERLAHIESISYIEESSDRRFRNDMTSWVVQSNQPGVTSIWNKGLHGEGQVAGLIDGGVYRGHDMFRDPVNNTPGPNHRKLVYYSSSYGINSSDAHGTHTGDTMAGDQFPITGSTFRNGIAYASRLAFTELDDVWGGGLYAALIAQHSAGARVHSNSWGDDGTTQYTVDCQQIDQYSWDHETGMVAFAVTNQSILKTPENAKSVLAVGATNQAPGQASVGSGGRGPTIDGRRKPEIFAPGIGIISARNGTTNQWRTMSGTSMACPAVTGAAALVRQYVTSGHLNNGVPGSRVQPTGALVRAMLMNSSVDMTGAAGYPSNEEGWGRLLLQNSLTFAGDQKRTLAIDVTNALGLLPNNSTEFRAQVTDSGSPLRVTLTFTDYPAQVFAGQAAVNDVDLEVIAPNGAIYKGNVVANGQSTEGGGFDPRNSTEMVILNQPLVGVYRIRGHVRAVNQGTRQGMAIVVNGRIRADFSRG